MRLTVIDETHYFTREAWDRAASVLSRDGEGPGANRGQRQSGGEARPSLGEDVAERVRITAFAQGGTRIVEIAVPGSYLGKILGLLYGEGLTALEPSVSQTPKPPLLNRLRFRRLSVFLNTFTQLTHIDPWRT